MVDIAGPLRVVVKVPESMVDQVRPGLVARVKGLVLGRKVLTGTVESVEGQADGSQGPSAGRQVYTTRVAIPTSPLVIRSGLFLTVEIVIAELDDVIAVPFAAVVLDDGRPHVLVKPAEGSIDWREVT